MNTQDIVAAVEAVHAAILANEQQIESLDRAIGDGDHFINVRRGCEAIAAMKRRTGAAARRRRRSNASA